MWFMYLKTLGLTAVQGLLTADSLPHPEKPGPAASKPSVVATAFTEGPLTEYELHYGIPRRANSMSTNPSGTHETP